MGSRVIFRRAAGGYLPLALLAATAGMVDALSLLRLGRVFTANMTGNIVLLTTAAGQGHLRETTHSLVALLGFVAGACAAPLIVGRHPTWAGTRTRHALIAEAVLLLVVAVTLGMRAPVVLSILPAGAAMGIQSGLVARITTGGLSTTYMTGALTALLGRLAEPARPDAAAAQRALVVGGLAAGAVFTALVLHHDEAFGCWIAVVAALMIVAVSVCCAGRRPAPG